MRKVVCLQYISELISSKYCLLDRTWTAKTQFTFKVILVTVNLQIMYMNCPVWAPG